MKLKDARETYRTEMLYMRDRFGWTATEFQDRCHPLAEMYIEKGEVPHDAWVSAAREVVSERQEQEAEQGWD